MARVTDAEVREIRPSTKIADYAPYIDAATVIVDELALSSCGKSLSAARLIQVEKWLAAHYGGSLDPQVAREEFEKAEKTYQIGNRQLFGLMSDTYGQTANMLSGGCLIEMDKRKFSMKAVGAVGDLGVIDS